METNKPNQFPSEDTKNTQSNTASSSGTDRTTKGKEKEQEIDVVKELDNLAKPSKEKWIAYKPLGPHTKAKHDMVRMVANNELFWMKPEQQKELIDEFEGLPKLVLKKIVANTGKYQLSIPGSIAKHTTGTILGILPFTGVVSNNANTAIIDNLQKIIEHSLTIPEIIEVFEEYEAEKIKKLLLIRDYVAAEQKKNAKIADLEKQLREAKNEIAELKSQLETQIEESEFQTSIQLPPKSPTNS